MSKIQPVLSATSSIARFLREVALVLQNLHASQTTYVSAREFPRPAATGWLPEIYRGCPCCRSNLSKAGEPRNI